MRAFAVVVAFVAAGCNHAASNDVIDGDARFQILSPSLIRAEFAADGQFEDGRSFNRSTAPPGRAQFVTRIDGDWREIETSSVLLRYRRGSGPFGVDNLTIQQRPSGLVFYPFRDSPANPLGGWLRSLDSQGGGVTVHPGLLDRDGWFRLDDSATALVSDGWLAARRARSAPYQDDYLFVYGHDYQRALADFVTFSGPPIMPPKWALGIWFSRFHAYSENDYRDDLIPHFRADQVPLDVLVVDTDWKSPSTGNGWSWNTSLFPDGAEFLQWAGSQGLHVSLNIHPSISDSDPLFADTNVAAGGLSPLGNGNYIWDWGNRQQTDSYFALHQRFENEGVRIWWLDWCCEAGTVTVPSPSVVTADSWINSLYAARGQQRGVRGFAFSRIGADFEGYGNISGQGASGPWADHRSTIHFTGDTFPTWDILAFEVAFTAGEASIGIPYVTHDIGSFFGNHLPEDLYLRWVQFGAFQPIFRLHSNHGDRLPWDYSDTTRAIAESFMRLRESLVPYLYTIAREAFDTGMPLARAMYLAYSDVDDAYGATNEYLLGPSLLVAPITSADGTTSVWFPKGTWTNIFTGAQYTGPSTQMVSAGLDTMPVYAPAGAIIVRQPAMSFVGERAVDPLSIDVYVGADGGFGLYDDDGDGLAYLDGRAGVTPIVYDSAKSTLVVMPPVGRIPNAATKRGYVIAFIGADPPRQVVVDGKAMAEAANGADGWSYDDVRRAVIVPVARRAPGTALTVTLK